MPPKAQRRLLARCETIELKSSAALHKPPDGRSQHVYFPTGSVFSLWTDSKQTPAFEFALIGHEGMLGGHLALGVPTSAASMHVHAAGSAWRMTSAQFRRELILNAPFRRSAYRYMHVTMMQAVTMAHCSRFHSLTERLARWLLMVRDRVVETIYAVTQESMAITLGVRRVGVTNAANELQRLGVIEYTRGRLTILDGRALEAIACACYSADLRSYAKFLS